jgi:hypothetical protein
MNNEVFSRANQVALKTVNNIFDQWELSKSEQAGFLTGNETLIRIAVTFDYPL